MDSLFTIFDKQMKLTNHVNTVFKKSAQPTSEYMQNSEIFKSRNKRNNVFVTTRLD